MHRASQEDHQTNTGAWDYHILEFTISKEDIGDTNVLEIEYNDGEGDDMYVDYILLIPVSNSNNFPLDLAHQAMTR